jgi:phage terminase large subunit-like protein
MWERAEDIKPLPGKNELAFKTKVDFMIYGGARGAAKSTFLTMRPLEYADDPGLRTIFFRRTSEELTGSNGLWEKAEQMYPLFDAEPNLTKLTWKFPAGGRIKFSHMFHEDDKKKHKGLGFTIIGFDEIDHFSKSQVTYLLTCLRSEANVDSFCIGTVNPDPDSWLLPVIKWYLDEKGFPDEKKIGKIRYFIIKNDDFIFADTEEWFHENERDSVFVTIPTTGEEIYIRPKTFTFISGNVFDNPPLLKSNPGYLSELQNLPPHERDRQLWGNWYARPTGSNYFERSWLKETDKVPLGARGCRAWDKASTEVSEVNRYPDYTAASPLIYKDKDGYYYLVGDYIPQACDKDRDGKPLPIKGRFRKRSGERDRIMILQALRDGSEIPVIIPEETAGKDSYEATKKKFLEEGLIVRKDVMPKTNSKLVKFEPFAAACSDGLVYIVKNTFNEETYNALMANLEAFNGGKSQQSIHYTDDWPDAVGSAFNYLSRTKRDHEVVVRNQNQHNYSPAKAVLDSFRK